MKTKLSPRQANVAVMVDPIGTYGRGIIRGVLSYHRFKRWRLSMLRTWIYQPAAFLADWDGDGLIAMIPDEQSAAEIKRTGKPVICVSSLEADLRPHSVVVDDRAVGRLAAQHFIDKGYRNYLFVAHQTGAELPAFIKLRRQGFIETVHAEGHKVESVLDLSNLAESLHQARRPLAMFTANDEVGVRAIALAEEIGLRVPEEVAVLGVDNDELLVASRNVGLSSIELPTFKIGFEAALALDRLFEGRSDGQEPLTLPPIGVVQRNSSDITAIADPEVAMALAFIRQHTDEPISVSDVVERVPLSRRSLERRFQEHLSRSILEEIIRLRLDRAAELLMQTDLSVEAVAHASGFSSRSRFHSAFAQARGCTPNVFREMMKSE